MTALMFAVHRMFNATGTWMTLAMKQKRPTVVSEKETSGAFLLHQLLYTPWHFCERPLALKEINPTTVQRNITNWELLSII